MNTFVPGDKVRSPLFAGVGEVVSVGRVSPHGRPMAEVKLERGFHDNLRDTDWHTMNNLRPAELPSYDLEFVTPGGNRSWITPALIRDVRDHPAIYENIQDKLDQILVETALDPEEWDHGVWEMPASWIGAILKAARERGLM